MLSGAGNRPPDIIVAGPAGPTCAINQRLVGAIIGKDFGRLTKRGDLEQ